PSPGTGCPPFGSAVALRTAYATLLAVGRAVQVGFFRVLRPNGSPTLRSVRGNGIRACRGYVRRAEWRSPSQSQVHRLCRDWSIPATPAWRLRARVASVG